MFKKSKLTKLVKRHGTRTVKTLFRVRVLRVLFPQTSKDIVEGSQIGVCFERGGKISSSRDVTVNPCEDGSVLLHFDEDTLSLVVTMYKDDDKFQEKIGNIVIRQKKKNVMGSDSFKGLGLASFSLDSIANSYAPTELTLPIGQCAISGAIVTIHITPKFIGEVDGTLDETMSMQSGFSGNNEIQAAEFGSNAGDDESIGIDSVDVATAAENTTQSAMTADNSTINEMRLEIATLTQKLIDMTSNYNSVCDENDRHKASLRESRNEAHKAEERAEEMSEQISSLEDKLTIQHDDVRELTVSLDNFKARTQELMTAKTELKLKLEQAEESCESSRGEAKELRGRVEGLTLEVLEWEKRLADRDAKVTSVEATSVSLQSNVSQLEEELKAKEEECLVLTTDIDAQQMELSSLQCTSTAHMNTISSQQKRLDELEASLQLASAQAEALQKEVECLRSEQSVKGSALLAEEQRVSELSALLAAAVEAKSTVDAELESVRSEAAVKDCTIAELKQRICDMTATAEESVDVRVALEIDLKALRISSSRNEEELCAAESRERELEKKLLDLQDDLGTQRNHNKELNETIKDLESRLGSDNSEAQMVAALLSSRSHLEEEVATLRASADKSLEDKRNIESELRACQAEIEKQDRHRLHLQCQHVDEVSRLESQVNDLASRVAELERDVAAKSVLIADLTVNEAALSTANTALQDELAERSRCFDNLVEEKGDLESTIESLQLEKEALATEKATLASSLLALESAHSEDKAHLESAIDAYKARITDIESSANESETSLISKNADLREQLLIAETRIDTLSGEQVATADSLQMLSREKSDQESQVNDLVSRVAELERDVAAKSVLIADLTVNEAALSTANTALQDELAERSRCFDNLVEEKGDLESTIESLQLEKEALVSEVTADVLEREAIGQKSQIAELQSHVEKQTEEIAALEAQRTQMRGEIEEHTRLANGCEAAAESLRNDILQLRSALDSRNAECARQTAIVDGLEGKIVSLSSSYDNLLDKKRAVQQDLTRVTEELHVLIDEHSKCASSSSELLGRCVEAEASAHDAKATLSALNEEISTLRGQNDILKEQVRDLEDSLDTAVKKQQNATPATSAVELVCNTLTVEQSISPVVDDTAATTMTTSVDETEDLLAELIDTKMKAASYAYESDMERRKVFALKRRLQIYAERVADLEVSIAENLNPVDISRRPKGGRR